MDLPVVVKQSDLCCGLEHFCFVLIGRVCVLVKTSVLLILQPGGQSWWSQSVHLQHSNKSVYLKHKHFNKSINKSYTEPILWKHKHFNFNFFIQYHCLKIKVTLPPLLVRKPFHAHCIFASAGQTPAATLAWLWPKPLHVQDDLASSQPGHSGHLVGVAFGFHHHHHQPEKICFLFRYHSGLCKLDSTKENRASC